VTRIFADRAEAGRALAEAVKARHYDRPAVLALPRGGVPIAAEIAAALGAPMDLVLVRKIGTPGQPELALGAVVDGPAPQIVINEDVRKQARVGDEELERATQAQLAEIDRRRTLYLGGRDRVPLEGMSVIVTDDGIATGATMRAALKALRQAKPARLVLAVPVAPAETLARLRDEVDDVICLETPRPFYAVGVHYRNFDPVEDDAVARLMASRCE